jgi:hypothetical protein
MSSSTTVSQSRVAPAATACSASQRSKRGRRRVKALYGRSAQPAFLKSTVSEELGDVKQIARLVSTLSRGALSQKRGTRASRTWGA